MSTLAEKIKVMQHFENGGEVEFCVKFSYEWETLTYSNWNWDKGDYRIKEDIKNMFEEKIKVTPEQYAELHKMPQRNDAEVFTKYGFEVPEFECRLYDKINDYIFGVYFNPNKGLWSQCRWDLQGMNKQGSNNYQLKPIKKPWYETCKYPAVIKSIKTGDMFVVFYKDGKYFNYNGIYKLNDNPNWVLVTNEEIEALKQ